MKRYSIYPIKYIDLWERYQAAENQMWVPGEVDLKNDKFDQLKDNEQKVLKLCLAYFAASDIIVNENIITNLIQNVKETEAEFYYGLQVAMENIHSITYGNFIEEYIKAEEKEEMYDAINQLNTIKKKSDWAFKYLDSSFHDSMVAFSCIEGLHFSSLFAFIFYFKDGGLLPGLCQGNILINKDENSHYEFAVHYFKNYIKNQDYTQVRKIILEAYEVEKTFVEEVLSNELPGLTIPMMTQYIQYVTDTILVDYGLEKEFNVSQPLQYMTKIALETRPNFFEVKSGVYTKIKQSKNLFDEII